jgi:hypothetical protein
MVRDEWEQAIMRALTDQSFQARLLGDPADTLSDYGLTQGEIARIEMAHGHSLAEFVSRFFRLVASEGHQYWR